MKSDSQSVKDLEKTNKPQETAKEDDDLEPCTSPHAVEALRFDTPDEACDDGVN
jgi:hypothetical protein